MLQDAIARIFELFNVVPEDHESCVVELPSIKDVEENLYFVPFLWNFSFHNFAIDTDLKINIQELADEGSTVLAYKYKGRNPEQIIGIFRDYFDVSVTYFRNNCEIRLKIVVNENDLPEHVMRRIMKMAQLVENEFDVVDETTTTPPPNAKTKTPEGGGSGGDGGGTDRLCPYVFKRQEGRVCNRKIRDRDNEFCAAHRRRPASSGLCLSMTSSSESDIFKGRVAAKRVKETLA